jgi:Acyl-CoA dehydrogenase, C-terminal domain
VPTPLLATTLAELALLSAADPDEETIGALAEGTSIGTVAFDVDYVLSGDVADVVIVADGDQLTRATSFEAHALTTMDPTRRLARMDVRDTQPIGPDPGIADLAAILLAAEQIGAASRCLDLTVAYTKDRVQFGRPIGSFQALKHRMADMLVLLEMSRSASWAASYAVSRSTANAAELAHTAKSYCGDALARIAGETVQLHGGIAITWEHDAQLVFKRAHALAQLFGQAHRHRTLVEL